MGSTSEGKFEDLSLLDEGQLTEMFQRRRNDLTFLNALNEELKQRNNEAANDLHIRVVMARRELVRARPSAEPPRAAPRPEPSYDWLHVFLRARNLVRPDGRPLYRYRMEDGEYEQAKKMLRRLADAGRLVEPDSRAGALFVAYCAEWFRRESASTFLRWDDPAPDLFPSVPMPASRRYRPRVWLTGGVAADFSCLMAIAVGLRSTDTGDIGLPCSAKYTGAIRSGEILLGKREQAGSVRSVMGL